MSQLGDLISTFLDSEIVSNCVKLGRSGKEVHDLVIIILGFYFVHKIDIFILFPQKSVLLVVVTRVFIGFCDI